MSESTDFDSMDFSAFDASQDSAVIEPQGDEVQGSINPAWEPYLANVPESLRPMVTPAFSEWDKGVQQRFQELSDGWAGFKQFKDNNVNPEELTRAYEVAQQLRQDPVSVFQALHQFFEQSPQYHQQLTELGLRQAIQQQQQAQNPNGESQFEVEDPRAEIENLKAQIAAQAEDVQNFFAQKQQEEEYNAAYNETLNSIESDFSALEQRIGRSLDPMIRGEIIKQAQVMGMQMGRYVSIVEAAPSVFKFIQSVRQGAKAAPRTVGAGSLPQSPTFDAATASDDERIAAVKAIAARYAERD